MAFSKLIRALGKDDAINIILKRIGYDGGPGSGNFGHAGRPGKRGGSAPKGGGSSGSEYAKQLKKERAEVLSQDQADQALFAKHSGIADNDTCVAAMRAGTASDLVNQYFDIMEKNGDPTPTKPIREEPNIWKEIEVPTGNPPKTGDWDGTRIRIMREFTGMSEEEARKAKKEFDIWFGGSWSRADTRVIDDYIDRDGAYGGEIYRGMKFSQAEYDEFMKGVEKGSTIRMIGMNSSWTSDEEDALRFSKSERPIILKCVKNKTSAPVDFIAGGGESEIIAHSKAQWTVLNVEEGWRTVITVVESEHRMSDDERSSLREKNYIRALDSAAETDTRLVEQQKYFEVVPPDEELRNKLFGKVAKDGGPGSGNFGHAGRPGKVGGSAPDDGMSGPSEENRELSGMQVRVAQSIAKKAMEHPKVYDDWASSLSADEALEIQEQFDRTHKPDENGYYSENISEYYERIWRMLAANAPEKRYENKPVDGKDLSEDYDWTGVSYTEPKFGQVIDTQIEDIIERQGFNGVPKVVSKDEFDKIVEENQNAPIMFRTFAAPDKATLSQYDKDLESGAWYVDCGIGGSKYGQGMYTAAAYPWNLDDLTSIYNDNVFDSAERGAVFSGRHNGEKEAYQLDYTNPMMMFDGGVDGETYAFFNDDPPDSIVVTKENGKFIDRMSGIAYDEEDVKEYIMYSRVNIFSKEELEKRDIERPLGQMREYVAMNEDRVLRNSPDGDAYLRRLWDLEDQSKPCHGSFKKGDEPPLYISAPKQPGSPEECYFSVDRDGKEITREMYDTLPEGIYMIAYEGRALYEGKEKMLSIRVDENGEKHKLETVYDDRALELESIERAVRIALTRGGQIYKCEDVTPVKPESHTSTRKMTLDPSTKMITYENLKTMHKNYLSSDRQSEGYRHKQAVKVISEREGFTEEQKEAFNTITTLASQISHDDELHATKSWKEAAEKIGGADVADRLTNDFFKVKWEVQEGQTVKDVGAFGALLGYDAVVCSNYGRTIVVLNRTKLILSDEKVEVTRGEAS